MFPSVDDSSALAFTFFSSIFLYLKFQYSNLSLGAAKLKAGTRAPEDFYQNKTPKQHHVDALDRAQRIVNNDLENIPLGLILAWASLAVLNQNHADGYVFGLHGWFVGGFALCRFLHTVTYKAKLTVLRTIMWMLSLVCVAGFVGNAVRFYLPSW